MPNPDTTTPLLGFPRIGRFTKREQLFAYFSGREIQCLLCGRWWEKMESHLKAHGMTTDEYRQAYGIPWTYGLSGSIYHEKSSAQIKQRRERGEFGTPAQTKKMQSLNPYNGTHRPLAPVVADILRHNVHKATKVRLGLPV